MPLRELNDNVARLTIRLNSGRNHQACGYGDPQRRSRSVWRFLRAPAVRAATFCGCTAGVPQPISLARCSSLRCQVRRLWEALGWIPKRSLPKLQLRHSPSRRKGTPGRCNACKAARALLTSQARQISVSAFCSPHRVAISDGHISHCQPVSG